jgi:hypothetical protein
MALSDQLIKAVEVIVTEVPIVTFVTVFFRFTGKAGTLSARFWGV